MTIVSSLKHIYIFNRENPQNSEPQNGPRRGLDFIALNKLEQLECKLEKKLGFRNMQEKLENVYFALKEKESLFDLFIAFPAKTNF